VANFLRATTMLQDSTTGGQRQRQEGRGAIPLSARKSQTNRAAIGDVSQMSDVRSQGKAADAQASAISRQYGIKPPKTEAEAPPFRRHLHVPGVPRYAYKFF